MYMYICISDITVRKREDEDDGTVVAADLKIMASIAIRARTVVTNNQVIPKGENELGSCIVCMCIYRFSY